MAPEVRDVHDPIEWEPSVLFHPEARAALERVRSWGLVDAFRLHHREPGFYTWWDYRLLSFPKNRGLRIDHLLVTDSVAARCKDCWIDREARKRYDAGIGYYEAATQISLDPYADWIDSERIVASPPCLPTAREQSVRPGSSTFPASSFWKQESR